MHAPYLIGSKLYLRALDRADSPLLQRFMNHPEVNRTIAAWRPVTIEAEGEWLERMGRSEHDLVLGIVPLVDDRLIGVCGLHAIDWQNRHASFGIAIGETGEWGKGYGTEATRLLTRHGFQRLNLHRIQLDVYDLNDRAQHIYEAVGFRREGVLREAVFRDGAYHSVHRMAMLAAEWKDVASQG
jgi:RimJ/RimL family protein N-acetyltransferase